MKAALRLFVVVLLVFVSHGSLISVSAAVVNAQQESVLYVPVTLTVFAFADGLGIPYDELRHTECETSPFFIEGVNVNATVVREGSEFWFLSYEEIGYPESINTPYQAKYRYWCDYNAGIDATIEVTLIGNGMEFTDDTSGISISTSPELWGDVGITRVFYSDLSATWHDGVLHNIRGYGYDTHLPSDSNWLFWNSSKAYYEAEGNYGYYTMLSAFPHVPPEFRAVSYFADRHPGVTNTYNYGDIGLVHGKLFVERPWWTAKRGDLTFTSRLSVNNSCGSRILKEVPLSYATYDDFVFDCGGTNQSIYSWEVFDPWGLIGSGTMYTEIYVYHHSYLPIVMR